MAQESTLDLKALKANKNIKARNYWKQRLADFEWNSYFDNNIVFNTSGNKYEVYTLQADQRIASVLTGIAGSDKARHIVLLGTLGILAQKYSSDRDVCIFSPLYSEGHTADPESSIVPVRMNDHSGMRFPEFLNVLKESLIQDLQQVDYPLHKIVNKEKDVLRKLPVTGMLLEEIQQAAAFDYVLPDLLFSFSAGGNLTVSIKYNAGKFSHDTVAQIARLYFDLLEKLISGREQDISHISLLAEEDEFQTHYLPEDTAQENVTDDTIISLFEKQAAITPDNIALSEDDHSISYSELERLSDSIAICLQQQKDVQPGDLVGLLLERELYLLPVILAILKAGAAYIPLDPAYPPERVKAIGDDSRFKLLITREKFISPGWQELSCGIMNMDLELVAAQQPATATDATTNGATGTATFEKAPIGNAPLAIRPASHDLAYVIYTSGSTGVPKGVMIEHCALVNYIQWAAKQYTNGEKAGFALCTSISFDLTVTSLFVPLITGNRVFIYEKGDENHLLIEQVMAKDQVEVIKLTPAHLRVIRDSELLRYHIPRTIKRLIVGGEQLQTRLARDIYEKYEGKVEIFNEYGPTETTVGCMIHRFDPKEQFASVPIGVAIQNTQIYVLDAFLQPVAAGVKGELYVAGGGLARGYLGREVLTLEKFIDNPFRKGRKMYRTGDVAIRLPGGKIVFSGRTDDQVKIRGYRIEPDEIGNQLRIHDQINEAVVVAKEKQEDKYLVAYYTAPQRIGAEVLQQHLRERLPEYMVPQHFVHLDKMPVTINGKLNKKALPDVDMHEANNYIAPETGEEKLMADIWTKVLGIEPIGVTDNFFSLGGDSIKSIQVVSRIESAGYELSINDIFSTRTLQELSQRLKATVTEGQVAIKQPGQQSAMNLSPVPVQAHYPLSAAQGRLWVLSQPAQGNIVYNMRSSYVFTGDLNREALEYSFNALIERHESLRTVFKADEQGDIAQFILPAELAGFKMLYRDLRLDEFREDLTRSFVQTANVSPFDLSRGPLLKAELCQLEDHKWVFTYVMHHIISDGWSIGVLFRELLQFYNARIKGDNYLPVPLRIQYKDYSAWQQEQLSGEDLTKHKEYWLGQFAGSLPVLALRTDKTMPSIKTNNGGTIHKRFEGNVSRAIKAICKEQGSTLFMGVLAVVNVLLYKYTGQEDIIIGSPIAGREHIDLEDQIGFYLNTLALRTRFNGEDSYLELLDRVKEVTLAAYEHQIYPFDELIGEIDLPAGMSRNPLFDVMVVLQNTEIRSTETPEDPDGLRISVYEDAENLISAFDLSFDFIEIGEEIQVSIEYNSDLYYKATVLRVAAELEQLMKNIAERPSVPISELQYLRDGEDIPFRDNIKNDLVDDLML